VQLADVFIPHRVLIVPVTDDGHVQRIITRSEFFKAIRLRRGPAVTTACRDASKLA
jgi:hypothetical protein